jgi:perosamine synthetase
LPVDLDPVLKIAKKYNLKVIEDAAELIGQTYKGKPCGSFGDVSTFSFYANKHITTGEGGALLTNNKTLDKKFKSLRNLCFEKKRFVHREIGWNLRMTNLQASIGSAQLDSLKKIVSLKRKIGTTYNENLKIISNFIQLPLEKTQYADNIYWVYGIVIKKKCGITAQSLMNYLKKSGIETRPFFFPLHRQPIVKKIYGKLHKSFPNAESISKYGLYLPSGLGIEKKEIEYISKTLINFFLKKI